MQGNLNAYCFHVPGTLTANLDIRWTMAKDARVKELTGVASNDSDATIMLGISTDTNSILTAAVTGDSGVPVVKTRADFDAVNDTGVLNADDVVVLTVDYDGSAGTAAADLTVVLTLLEG